MDDEELFIRMRLLVLNLLSDARQQLSETRQQVKNLELLTFWIKEMESRCRMQREQREQTSEQPSIPLPMAQQNTQEEEAVPAVPKAMPTGTKPQVETVSDSGDNIKTVSRVSRETLREKHKRKRTEDPSDPSSSSSHALPLPGPGHIKPIKPRMAYLNLSEGWPIFWGLIWAYQLINHHLHIWKN